MRRDENNDIKSKNTPKGTLFYVGIRLFRQVVFTFLLPLIVLFRIWSANYSLCH
jgi:hypothetical protein